MSANIAYQKAIYLLSRPLSLTAILLLLLNDHLLRLFWPSWLTGKLGDFAWLFFFPFALAALLAWVIPSRWKKQAQVTGGLACGLTGGIFALAKCVPAFHAALTQAASRAFGFPVSWRMDPSDLLALSALFAGWLFWQHTPDPLPRQTNRWPRPSWLLLTSAALLTVANSVQPQAGIGCLSLVEHQVQACSSYECYTSQDGGLTWAKSIEIGAIPLYCSAWYNDTHQGQVIQDPADESIQYRTHPGESIELSTDGGQTWQVEYSLRPYKQAERAYYIKTAGGNAVVFAPPLAALADPESGNVIFAMGYAGVLVRQVDGEYIPVPVGEFTPARPGFGKLLMTVLSSEGILALAFGGLGAATLGLPPKRHWTRMVLLILGWLAWAVTSLFFPPALAEGAYSDYIPSMGTMAAGVLALLLAAEALIRNGGQAGKLALRLGMALLGSALLYFLPFMLWLGNILPVYYLALGFGVLLAAGWLVFSYKTTRAIPRQLEV
jgi:hypothetical protein